MLAWQEENAHIKRRLAEPCPFCLTVSADLWFDPAGLEWCLPFQVRCSACGARGPECDCGEESAVPSWLLVKSDRQ